MQTYASAAIGGGRALLNCMADSRLSHTHEHTRYSKSLLKKHFSIRGTQRHACHLSSPPPSEPRGSGVIWCRHAPRAAVRHRVTPHRARLCSGSPAGLEAAAAVRCCKWLSELTDRSLADPAASILLDQAAFLDPLCVVWMRGNLQMPLVFL